LSQRLGLFTESETGRQQIALKRVIGHHILEKGYCITPRLVSPALHPEQGPVWEWIAANDTDLYSRFSPNYMSSGPGAGREIDRETVAEINRIFEVSGGKAFFEKIEAASDAKAREMGFDGATTEYMMHTYTYNSNTHQ
jgi:heterodisulfide reductase subunit C